MVSALVLVLACFSVNAEETTTEKNEAVERYILAEKRGTSPIKMGRKKHPTIVPKDAVQLFCTLEASSDGFDRSRLFILYRNLKLCD